MDIDKQDSHLTPAPAGKNIFIGFQLHFTLSILNFGKNKTAKTHRQEFEIVTPDQFKD